MSASGAQSERELGRQGQAPAISPEMVRTMVSSVAGRPSFPFFVSFDVIVRQLAKARVQVMLLRRKKGFSALEAKGGESADADGPCTLSDYLPSRNDWKRPPASKRKNRTSAEIAEQAILRTVHGLQQEGGLEGERWGQSLVRLVNRVNERVDDTRFEFHKPKLLLKRKDAKAFRCLASYEDIGDKLILYGLSNYLRECFDPFVSAQCHSFRLDGGKTHHSAVRELTAYRLAHPGETLYVAECDIMKFFDAVDHREILKACDAFTAKCGGVDPRARTIVKAYLESYSFRESVAAAVREDPVFARNADRIGRLPDSVLRALHADEKLEDLRLGLPQGGAVSPLFANILLATADEAVLGDGSDPDLLYLRFCDDMVIVHTDREKCKGAMDRYLAALARLRLPVHPPAAAGFAYGAEYYKVKTKEPFEWREASMGERNAAPWVSFLGYQVNFKGELRIRKETLDKHKRNLKFERARLNRQLEQVPVGNGRARLMQRYCRYLVSKGIGRLLPGAIRENARCWAAAFPNLKGLSSAECCLQMRSLDVLRDRLSRFVGDGFLDSASRLFYGRPFSYFGYLQRMDRPSLRTLRKKPVTNGGDSCLTGMKTHE